MGENWGGEMDPECSSFDRLNINHDVTEHCDVIGGEHCDVIVGDETEESLGASSTPF